MKPLVHIRRCGSYRGEEVSRAVASAVEGAVEAGVFPETQGKRVLLKPNMLIAADPERAISTHPELLRAAIREFKARGAQVVVGESPAVQGGAYAARKCGLLEVAEDEGVQWVDFSATVGRDNPRGRLVKRFEIAQEAARADLIVSLPKLKTHQLMYYTGAMKNLFGVISGLQKAHFHLRFPERQDFARMLTDLCLALEPGFAIMDGITAMEGHGPANGNPRQVGLVLASADILALDWTAASIIGYDPSRIPNLADARERGVWMAEEPAIDGPDLESLKIADFKRIKEAADIGFGRNQLPGPVYRLVRNLTVPRPFFRDERCIRCGQCAAICPAAALTLEDSPRARAPESLDQGKRSKRIRVDYDPCLRCYCCHEVCPVDAIAIRRF